MFSKVHLTSAYMHAHIYINCIHFWLTQPTSFIVHLNMYYPFIRLKKKLCESSHQVRKYPTLASVMSAKQELQPCYQVQAKDGGRTKHFFKVSLFFFTHKQIHTKKHISYNNSWSIFLTHPIVSSARHQQISAFAGKPQFTNMNMYNFPSPWLRASNEADSCSQTTQ